jgi:hypothetical protein
MQAQEGRGGAAATTGPKPLTACVRLQLRELQKQHREGGGGGGGGGGGAGAGAGAGGAGGSSDERVANLRFGTTPRQAERLATR